jgi:hypothetical protein
VKFISPIKAPPVPNFAIVYAEHLKMTLLKIIVFKNWGSFAMHTFSKLEMRRIGRGRTAKCS